MLTAPTWTYSAAGGPNPFIVPATGGFIAVAVNTESGATIVGLGRRATRFARPLKLEPRGVAIFAQPSPHTLPEHVWAVGYSTTPGVAPRVIGISREGNIVFDVPRPELAWREGRTIAITETHQGPLLHIDDRHLLLDHHGDVVIDLPRKRSDSPYAVEGGKLYAHDGTALVAVDLATGQTVTRIPLDGHPSSIRVDPWHRRLVVRIDRVLISLDLEEQQSVPCVRTVLGGLCASPTAMDTNLRITAGPPAGVECMDDNGMPRWSMRIGGATAVSPVGLFVGGETLLTSTVPAGDRVLIAREGTVIFERPRAGAVSAAGTMARIGDRVAVIVAPGAPPSEPIEFASTMEVATIRGGGAVAFERANGTGNKQRMVVVDPAGARVIEVTESGLGARWAAASDGLIAVPRTHAARIDLYDTGAPA